MYNTDLPTREELPSSKQLIRSTLIAAGVAIALLITIVLPAEYGTDPSGVGSLLGLTKMGEIKVSLAKEATQDVDANTQPVLKQQAIPVISSTKPSSARIEATPFPNKSAQQLSSIASHQKSFTLKPGEATEIKLRMKKGEKVAFQWTTEGGNVNFDTHGDSATLDYYGYGKGRQVAGDNGVLIAAFDGNHGWFWRNRSESDVTITLNTQGNYQSIDRKI